jgi:DNA-binding beta-propeller fold protein YncE
VTALARPIRLLSLRSLALALGALFALQVLAADSQFAIATQWKLGGAGGWDYLTLDAGGKRLFVTRGDRVDVVDTASGKMLGSIANTVGVHGVALAPALGRGFASNGRGEGVTVFEIDSLKPVSEVKLSGKNPDAIYYDAPTQHVFTFNARTSDASVIDGRTLAVLATIPLAGKPEFMAGDGHGQLFVNIETEAGQLQVIDTATLKVSATWSLPGCSSPSGLALDAAHRRLFSVCDARVMAVTDADSGRQVAKITIGDGPDAAAFDPALGLAYSSNGESGTLTVVHEDDPNHFRVVATLPTQATARTMALDPTTHRIYLAAADVAPAPPAPEGQARPRRSMVPESFVIVVAAPR